MATRREVWFFGAKDGAVGLGLGCRNPLADDNKVFDRTVAGEHVRAHDPLEARAADN